MTRLKEGGHVYFLGIGGTGMAAVAGLTQQAGYRVTGSDAGVYPPMSTMLDELNIKVKTPYTPDNLKGEKPDLVVVANVLSRGNPELEYVLESGIPYTSFPALLGDHFLSSRVSCVVAGTHGKTTTTALLAHVLEELGENPGFMIGGIPKNFQHGFRLGKGKLFCIEGDEYDTAFFDKGPKFLHYRPQCLILNNLEFDHADIYPTVEAIEAQFQKLTQLVAKPALVIANADDTGIVRVLKALKVEDQVTRVATMGEAQACAVRVLSHEAKSDGTAGQVWTAELATKRWGVLKVQTGLSGRHNLANIAQVVAAVMQLEAAGHLARPVDAQALSKAIASFSGVARRLEHLGSFGGIDVFEDFAHHPTAVKLVIEGFRQVYPNRRLVVAFEPRSATQRRNVFQKDYARTLCLADRVYIGECPLDKRIPEDQRMNTTAIEQEIGPTKAKAYPTNVALLEALKTELKAGDAVIFMSSGSFSGAQHELAKDLRSRYASS